jgi:hypothetical protein
MLGAPKLKKLELLEACLSKDQVDHFLVMIRESIIVRNYLELTWINDWYMEKWMAPWMIENRLHFDFLLDSLEAAFPQMKLQRYIEVKSASVFIFIIK